MLATLRYNPASLEQYHTECLTENERGYQCQCGSNILAKNLVRHINSKKHKKFLNVHCGVSCDDLIDTICYVVVEQQVVDIDMPALEVVENVGVVIEPIVEQDMSREVIQCECGKRVQRRNLGTHKFSQYHRKYEERNQERVYGCELMTCVCGKTVQARNWHRHTLSRFHRDYMERVEEEYRRIDSIHEVVNARRRSLRRREDRTLCPVCDIYVPTAEYQNHLAGFSHCWMEMICNDIFRDQRPVQETHTCICGEEYKDISRHIKTKKHKDFLSKYQGPVDECDICYGSHHPKNFNEECSTCRHTQCIQCTVEINKTSGKCPFCRSDFVANYKINI